MELVDGVYLYFQNMPISIRAVTLKNSDDTFTILANARHSDSRLAKAIKHELSHIEVDFNSSETADEIEILVRERIS